jgi:hypothetical protein
MGAGGLDVGYDAGTAPRAATAAARRAAFEVVFDNLSG